MAPGNDSLHFGDPALLARYDDRSVARGVSYAADRRVAVLDVSDGWAMGEVQGNADEPYMVDVYWQAGPRGTRVVDDDCSCPLGGQCKHAVALVVTIALNRVGDEAATARPQASPAWRSALYGIDEPYVQEPTPLALQFSLVTRPHPHVSNVRRTDVYSERPSTQLQVRPMRMGGKERWVKSGVSWQNLGSSYMAHELRHADPLQLALLRSMHANASLTYDRGDGWLSLDRFDLGLWPALRQLADSGVRMIVEGQALSVRLDDRTASLSVDLVATPVSDVEVRSAITLDGSRLSLEEGRAGTIGSPLHGCFMIEGGDLVLVQFKRPVPSQLGRMVGGPPLVVPARDVDELIDVYQPQLARHAQVGSSDGSIVIHATEFDGIVALIDHSTVDTASLRWVARYHRGPRVRAYPLDGPIAFGRDEQLEAAVLRELELPVHLLDRIDYDGTPSDMFVKGVDAVVLLTQVVPWLQERGQVAVEVSGDAPPLREATENPLVSLTVTDPDEEGDRSDGDEAAGRSDWFDLSVDVTIDGEPVEFVRLFSALVRDEPVLVLPSGTWLHLDRPELDRLRSLINEARGLAEPSPSSTVRINRFQTSWWDELTALGVVRRQSQRWARDVEALGQLSAPTPVDPPATLDASLRPYQQEGLDWLAFLHRSRLGGILADDMGLGKTVQVLALFLHVLSTQPDARFLVIAPTSVVSNWKREAAQFAPTVPVATIHETEKRRGQPLSDAIGDARIVVTSYALFRLEFEEYQALGWDVLVLDEAQFVKNHRGKTYHCVRKLDVDVKIAVTGTPIENSLMDLWSLLSIAAPGLYPDPKRFADVYRKPIESGRAPELLATLRRRVAPLMRRRTKGEVLTELPPKIEQTIDIELSPRHMRIYQAQLQLQRQKVLGLVGDVDKNRFEILKSLTILRQLSLDPGLIDPENNDVGSAKLDRLGDDLQQVVAEGHRALVFSQFTRYLARVRSRLDEAGIDHAYLDGRTRKRDDAIAEFKDGDAPVFVISLKAGGVGLTLTEADYCFVLDPWWNPATETQAVDRAHRIGQRNAVMVYRYVSTGTIEEKVMELKERKAALFSSVMDADDALSGALSADDITALFE